MQFEKVAIHHVAYVDAPHRITSAELEAQLSPAMQRFRVPQGLLAELTGIEARNFWEPGITIDEAAALAGEKVIQESGIPREKIGVLISTSVSRDYIEPSVASMVHHRLGLSPKCRNFDIGNACLGFVDGIETIANMIELGQIEYGLIVDAENSRIIIENTIERLLSEEATPQMFRQQFASLTLGCGSVAMIVSRADLAQDGHAVKRFLTRAATEHNQLCLGRMEQMVTDHKQLLLAGLGMSTTMRTSMLEEWGIEPNDMDEVVIHQVSKPHTEQSAEVANVDLDKIFTIYPQLGNIGPAGVPTVLAKSYEAGRITSGDRVGLFGIGSGLNSTAVEIIW